MPDVIKDATRVVGTPRDVQVLRLCQADNWKQTKYKLHLSDWRELGENYIQVAMYIERT
jgi:hypothetical protein